MFCKFVRFDLKHGLVKEWKKFLVALCAFLAFFSIYYLRVVAENRNLAAQGEEPLEFTFIDLILSVLGGMKEFHYEDGEMFLFPAVWIFFFLLLLFYTLRYPTQNLDGIGKSMLILSQNRRVWWLSKCVWCCVYVFVYFLLLYISAFLMGLCLGGRLSFQPSEYAPYALDAGMYLKSPPWNLIPGLGLVPLVACGVTMLQMILTLWVKPIFAYVVSCVLLLFSAYFANPVLVGNYAMLFRTGIFTEKGFPLWWGFVAATLLIVLSLLVGCFRVERMDILNRE